MLFAILVAAAASSTPAIAPLTTDNFNPEARGTVGFEFVLPGGGASSLGANSIGVTYFIADNLAARVDFGLDAVLSPSGTPATFDIGLGLRMYQLRHGPVAVFLAPQFIFGREVLPGLDGTEFITLAGSVGAEYFFTDHLSVGGQLGLGLKIGALGAPAGVSARTELSTAPSELFANFYF